MRRICTFAFLGVGVLLSHAVDAQQPDHVPRIGFLGPTSSAPSSPSSALGLLDEFRKALAEHGLVEGRNIVIDSRWPDEGRLEQLPEVAATLASLKPDVMVAIGATATRAAKSITTEIPIVFEIVGAAMTWLRISNGGTDA